MHFICLHRLHMQQTYTVAEVGAIQCQSNALFGYNILLKIVYQFVVVFHSDTHTEHITTKTKTLRFLVQRSTFDICLRVAAMRMRSVYGVY